MRYFRVFKGVAVSLLLGLAAVEAEPQEASAAASARVAADDPLLGIMGRVAMFDGAAHMGFPGVTIRFAYRGPAPIALFEAGSEDCYFDVSLDGSQPLTMRLRAGANEVPLPLAPGGDEGSVVEIVRRTEASMGEVVFQGLLMPEGSELLSPPAWPRRRLLLIGDSIVSGSFNARFPPREESLGRATNAARSHGMILAERLDAQVHLVAYGGQGVLRDGTGAVEGDDMALAADFFERSLPRAAGAFWDHSQYVPEVILVNFGEELLAGPVAEEAYLEAYELFVQQVRSTYPLSYIALCESSFLSGDSAAESYPLHEMQRRVLATVVARSREAGDQRILILQASHYPGTPQDHRLTAFQHERLADELVEPIRRFTGWR